MEDEKKTEYKYGVEIVPRAKGYAFVLKCRGDNLEEVNADVEKYTKTLQAKVAELNKAKEES